MLGQNPAALSATASGTATSQTATVNAIANRRFQIVAFSGSSTAQTVSVALKFGSTTQMTLTGAAGTAVGHFFGENGPIADTNTAVTVVTTPAASDACAANVLYRIVL